MKRTRPTPRKRIETSPGTDRLLGFLGRRASYPHRPRRVRMVQTHASWVFLAPPYVFKVKKPVNFGFLDFSTLAKRRHFCEREVDLNRRLSPHTYLGVLPIMFDGRRLAFDGNGPAVEYAVKMRQLSAGGFLDRQVERGAVGRKELDRLAGWLTKFYQSQHPTPEIEAWGRIDRLKLSTNENFRQTKPFVGKTLTSPAFETIRAWTNRFYCGHPALFASRIRERRVRDCHGDLHLEHIHLTKDAVTIYDCIEFNDRFRYVDVANDLAFLTMDLDFRGRPELAAYFERRMAAKLKDLNLHRLSPFYRCYRAYVRGKVESFHSVTPGASGAERAESANRAARYFRLALNYAVAGTHPMVLIVMGRIASGKSTLAAALGHELGWPVLSSDRVRKELAGVPLTRRVGGAARQRLYSARMTSRTYGRLLAEAGRLIRSGRSTIIDATFSRREQRRRLIRHFERRRVTVRFVEACSSDRAVQTRLLARSQRPGEISDARLEDFERLNRRYNAPGELPAARRVRVSTKGPVERTVTRVLRALAESARPGHSKVR